MTIGVAFFGGSSVTPITFNPSDKHADIALSSGNLIATKTTGDATRSVRATQGRAHTDNGYFEIFNGGANATTPYRAHGISTTSLSVASYPGSDLNSWGYYEETGQKIANAVFSTYGSAFTTGDVIGVAFKNGKVWFAKNNVWQNSGDPAAGTGEAFSGITGTIYPTGSLYRYAAANAPHVIGLRVNSSQCTYAPPSGFGYWER